MRKCQRGLNTASTDRGQSAVIVMVVVAALGFALAVALADFGGRVQERTRAQSVADAAALASVEAASDGALASARALAVDIADQNGAVLVSWVAGPGSFEVTVVVRVGDATATARASNAP